jgi:hypothetical protein
MLKVGLPDILYVWWIGRLNFDVTLKPIHD